MNVKKQPRLIGALILLLGLGIVGCDNSESTDNEDFASLEVQDLYNAVESELQMTTDQQHRFARALQSQDRRNREPGFLWIVADSLAQTLTDEQKAELIERTGALEGPGLFRGLAGFPGSGGYYGFGGFMGASRRFGDAPIDKILDLTEEQIAAIHELHSAFREDAKALKDELRDGSISRQDFLSAMLDLHEALRADIAAVLTDEQKAQIEEFHAQRQAEFDAFREAVAAVRDEVLGLTPEESEAFDQILMDHLDAREVLHEQFLEGEIDRATLQSEIEALQEVKDAALQALLSEAQYEVVQIHDALAVRLGRRGHHGGPDVAGNGSQVRNGNGGNNGNGNGNGNRHG